MHQNASFSQNCLGCMPFTRLRSGVRVWTVTGGRFTKNLKITIHTWDIFIILEKHHQCHCIAHFCSRYMFAITIRYGNLVLGAGRLISVWSSYIGMVVLYRYQAPVRLHSAKNLSCEHTCVGSFDLTYILCTFVFTS